MINSPQISAALILFALFFSTSTSGQDYGITVFGSDLITSAQIQKDFEAELDELLRLYESNQEEYQDKRKLVEGRLERDDRFGYVDLTLFKSYSGNFSYIIDLVEKKDVDRRLRFREMEVKTLEDPDSLVYKWKEYEKQSWDLFNVGEISDMKCPVIHCTWSFHHPDLRPFLKHFNEFAPANKEQLIEILNHSDSASFRAASPFLLAHAGLENSDLLEILMPSIKDPSGNVRNNSMRVVYYIVKAFPESKINIDDVIQALDYPSFTDRNKALVILRSLPLEDLTKENLRRLLPILLEIIEKKDAHNYRNAHTVIEKISGEDFSADEIAEWKRWVESVLKD